jgi:hypothetical protein
MVWNLELIGAIVFFCCNKFKLWFLSIGCCCCCVTILVLYCYKIVSYLDSLMGTYVYSKKYKGQSLCGYELCVAYIGYVQLFYCVGIFNYHVNNHN